MSEPKIPAPKLFACGICPKVYSDPETLRNHRSRKGHKEGTCTISEHKKLESENFML
jgi:hypothetical protein